MWVQDRPERSPFRGAPYDRRGPGKGTGVGPSKRLAELYDRYATEKHPATLMKEAPLQTLTSRELDLVRLPMTICPRPRGCQVWVRIRPHAVRVAARIVRSTLRAAGIEFVVEELGQYSARSEVRPSTRKQRTRRHKVNSWAHHLSGSPRTDSGQCAPIQASW